MRGNAERLHICIYILVQQGNEMKEKKKESYYEKGIGGKNYKTIIK